MGKRIQEGGQDRTDVTPSMVEAGAEVLWDWVLTQPDQEVPQHRLWEVAAQVFAAMEARRGTSRSGLSSLGMNAPLPPDWAEARGMNAWSPTPKP